MGLDAQQFEALKNNEVIKVVVPAYGVAGAKALGVCLEAVADEYLARYRNKHLSTFTVGERCFFDEYCVALTNDRDVNITPQDYRWAMRTLFLQTQKFNAQKNKEYYRGVRALQKFRLAYVVDKIGMNRLDKVMDGLMLNDQTDLFARVSEALGEPIETVYSQLETTRIDSFMPDEEIVRELPSYFRMPKLLELDSATRSNFSQFIHEHCIPDEIHEFAMAISFYLENYLLHEGQWSLADVLWEVAMILDRMSGDESEDERELCLFGSCTEVIDRCWFCLDKGSALQNRFCDIVYTVYWPWVGDLQLTINDYLFEYKNPERNTIVKMAQERVFDIDDILDRNQEVRSHIEKHAQEYVYKNEALDKLAYHYIVKDMRPRKALDLMLKDPQRMLKEKYAIHPPNVLWAGTLLSQLFAMFAEGHCDSNLLMLVRKMMRGPNQSEVGALILSSVAGNLEQLIEAISEARSYKTAFDEIFGAEPLAYEEHVYAPGSFIIDACDGITEKDEVPALHELISKYFMCGSPGDKPILEYYEERAKRQLTTVLFQREGLTKFFQSSNTTSVE